MQSWLLPLERLGIPADADLWAYEFWSGQFCGRLPLEPSPPATYVHPGDMQMPLRRPERGLLSASFFGPGVMLLALRTARAHPWVVGTTFNQSSGLELAQVRWDAGGRALSGLLRRPIGETGAIVLAGLDATTARATVDGRDAPLLPGASGSALLPVSMGADQESWRVVMA